MSNNNTLNFSNPQNNHRPQMGHPGNYQNQNFIQQQQPFISQKIHTQKFILEIIKIKTLSNF